MLAKYGWDKRALYSAVLNTARSQWKDGPTILRQLNEAFKWYSSQTPKSTTTPVVKDEAADKQLTGIDSIDKFTADKENDRANQLWFLENQNKLAMDYIDAMAESRNQTTDDVAKTIDDRLKKTEETFWAIQDSIDKLSEYANKLFDINVVNAIQQRWAQLAAKGILTTEQAAWATGGIMTLYSKAAEAQRLEVLKVVQQATQDALVEKNNAIDAILADKQLSFENRANALERINRYYGEVISSYTNNWITVNQNIDSMVDNARLKVVELDIERELQKIVNEAPSVAEQWARDRANTNADERLNYLMTKINQTDPNLSKYAASIIDKYVKDGTFMQRPLLDILSEVMRESSQAFIRDQWGTVPWSSTPAAQTTADNIITNAMVDNWSLPESQRETVPQWDLQQQNDLGQIVDNILNASGSPQASSNNVSIPPINLQSQWPVQMDSAQYGAGYNIWFPQQINVPPIKTITLYDANGTPYQVTQEWVIVR